MLTEKFDFRLTVWYNFKAKFVNRTLDKVWRLCSSPRGNRIGLSEIRELREM